MYSYKRRLKALLIGMTEEAKSTRRKIRKLSGFKKRDAKMRDFFFAQERRSVFLAYIILSKKKVSQAEKIRKYAPNYNRIIYYLLQYSINKNHWSESVVRDLLEPKTN